MEEVQKTVKFNLEEYLNKDTFFASLSHEDTVLVADSMTTASYKKGEILAHEGEVQRYMFVVLEGTIIKSHGKEEERYLKPGAITGMLHFLTKDPAFSTLKIVKLNDAYIQFLSKQLRAHATALDKIRKEMMPAAFQVAFFDTKPYMREAFEVANKEEGSEIKFSWFKEKLSMKSVALATGFSVVCCFVNDVIDKDVVNALADQGVKLIAMRCAGYDNVDLDTCKERGISVTRVPAYSPYAVAEFAVSLMLTLNRKLHKAWGRVRDFNFSLNGLVGFDMHGKTVGLFGTGQIGKCTANILNGFGCKVLAYDVKPDLSWSGRIEYVTKEELFARSHIISIHVPLLPSTKHIINESAFKQMRDGAILINTSRGGIVDSKALLDALSSGKLGAAGLDVYEGEKAYFFENRSTQNITDDILSRLIAAHNVVVTSHQAFLTRDALSNIAKSTIASCKEFREGKEGSQLTNTVIQQYS